MLTSKWVITKLRGNAAIQKAINGNVGAGALVRRSALEAYLSDEFGIEQVITNDLTRKTRSHSLPQIPVEEWVQAFGETPRR